MSANLYVPGPQQQLVGRYRLARAAWHSINERAPVVTMTEREYCDAYVASLGGITWTSFSACEPFPLDADAAFTEAASS